MKLLIHDYNNEEWSKVATNYEGWKIISDDGNIRPCIGCFGCWLKTPGQCVIKDGYDQMGKLIHEADEVLIISKYTYEVSAICYLFSAFIKVKCITNPDIKSIRKSDLCSGGQILPWKIRRRPASTWRP